MVKLSVALIAAATIGSALGTPAHAHHYKDVCVEVGLWDEQDRAPYKEAATEMGATVDVSNIPPMRLCSDNASPTAATQHTSLHARSKDGSQCLETVATRSSSGTIVMYGYNCHDFTNGGTTHTISNYGHPQMYLWMSSGGSSTWATWYFRRDENRWVFLANVTREPKLVPWAESSGYNASSIRKTSFESYWATNEFGTWDVPFSCGIKDPHYEYHQTQVTQPYAGDVVYEPHQVVGTTRCR